MTSKRKGRQHRPLQFITDPSSPNPSNPCITVSNRKPTVGREGGYFLVIDPNSDERYENSLVRKRTYLHRLIWQETNGPIPKEMCVLHKCHNRRCVRLDHLYCGTHADNMRDVKISGRGRSNKKGKPLTNEQIRTIQELRLQGLTVSQVCEITGHTNTTIHKHTKGLEVNMTSFRAPSSNTGQYGITYCPHINKTNPYLVAFVNLKGVRIYGKFHPTLETAIEARNLIPEYQEKLQAKVDYIVSLQERKSGIQE